LFRGRSISLKQGLLLVVLAALLPISITSILQSTANWNSMQRSAVAGLQANAKAIAERERDAFLVSSRLLMVAAANPDVQDMTARCSDVLRTGFRGFDPVVNFVRTDAAGRARCSILQFRRGTSFVGEPWWEKAKRSNSITVSQPTIGTVSGIPVIIMALPLKDAQGEFAGTLSAGIDISKLARSVAAAPESRTGSIAVISGNGEIVANSGREIPFDLPANLGKASAGTANSASGEKWMYEAVPVSGDDLFVVYAEPRSKIMSVASAQFRASIILPLIAIILTLCAIWFGTNRLVIRWLAALRKLSDEMTKGNFTDTRQAFAAAPLELRELSDDLHDMAHVIDSRTTELTDALNAKTELTREVHHRVKNNLQIVTSLLTMQAARMTDEGAQTALKQSRARIVALALIHRLTYEQDSPGTEPEVTVKTLINELSKQLRYAHRDHRNINLSCRADEYAMSVDLAVPFALFIVEAVTNSYRHAFPGGAAGKIDVSFVIDGCNARLEVQDNGAGYEVETPTGRQMGTELMEGFASQLNGSATFRSGRSVGSSVTLRFPVVAPSSSQSAGPSPA
jgi:two-component sensor histidine kinase